MKASTLIKKAPAGTATQIADERQSQLKLLIARGKEQGFLTYGEVNDTCRAKSSIRSRSKTSST